MASACFEKVIDAEERAMDPFSSVKNQWWLGMPPSFEA